MREKKVFKDFFPACRFVYVCEGPITWWFIPFGNQNNRLDFQTLFVLMESGN